MWTRSARDGGVGSGPTGQTGGAFAFAFALGGSAAAAAADSWDPCLAFAVPCATGALGFAGGGASAAFATFAFTDAPSQPPGGVGAGPGPSFGSAVAGARAAGLGGAAGVSLGFE